MSHYQLHPKHHHIAHHLRLDPTAHLTDSTHHHLSAAEHSSSIMHPSADLYGTTGDDNLTGTDQADAMFGSFGNDILVGLKGDDHIFGDVGNDLLIGNEGNDLIFAGPDNDTIYGGDNDDTILGEGGNDELYGGSGNDLFIFNQGDGSDTIMDFGPGDVIRLTGVTYSWGQNHNKPNTYYSFPFVAAGSHIHTDDGRDIVIMGIKPEQLKGGVVDGNWEWHL